MSRSPVFHFFKAITSEAEDKYNHDFVIRASGYDNKSFVPMISKCDATRNKTLHAIIVLEVGLLTIYF